MTMTGVTLGVAAGSSGKEVARRLRPVAANIKAATAVGKLLAEAAKAKGIEQVAFWTEAITNIIGHCINWPGRRGSRSRIEILNEVADGKRSQRSPGRESGRSRCQDSWLRAAVVQGAAGAL